MQSGHFLPQQSHGFCGKEHTDTSECDYLKLNLVVVGVTLINLIILLLIIETPQHVFPKLPHCD